MGAFSIGITAGTEVDKCSSQFIEGLNRMDLNIVPSNFTKSIFEQSVYEGRTQTGEKAILSLNKPVEVLFEGVDLNVYKKLNKDELDTGIKESIDNLNEKFIYLFVGH